MQASPRIDDHPILTFPRGARFTFQFNGRRVSANEGDTVAAALYADGVRIFSRSFKYHRPRGLFCLAGHCGRCMMRVDGVPNVRTCRAPAAPGLRVESQNAWPSLKFDLAAAAGGLDFLLRPGFQYRRFIEPRGLYHLWERFLRRMAGSGRLADATAPASPYVQYLEASPEVVVVGAGLAGLTAALNAAGAGRSVWLLEKEAYLGGHLRYDTRRLRLSPETPARRGFALTAEWSAAIERHPLCRVLPHTTAVGWYDENVLAAAGPGRLWALTPRQVVVATGSHGIPILFGNNDLPGIFLADGDRRLMHRDGMRPGRRAVVLTHHDDGYALARELVEAGVAVAAVVDRRDVETALADEAARYCREAGIPVHARHEARQACGRGRVRAIKIGPVNSRGQGLTLACDTVCMAGADMPANELLFQHTCRGRYVLEPACQLTRRPRVTGELRIAPGLYVAGGAGGARDPGQIYRQGRVAGLAAAGQADATNESRRPAEDALSSIRQHP